LLPSCLAVAMTLSKSLERKLYFFLEVARRVGHALG